nr:F-box domain, leucine-rich repeat domain, L domain-like protein [Tanacetum cinerariifolium]
FDDEDLINVDDDGVDKMSADVARSHGGDDGGEDRPPPHHVFIGCGGQRQTKAQFGRQGSGQAAYPRQDPKPLVKGITDKKGPVPIRFEARDKHALMSFDDHAAHWSSYIREVIRGVPLYYPFWLKVPKERKATLITDIGTQFNLRPHIESPDWTEIDAGIQQHLQNVQYQQGCFQGPTLGYRHPDRDLQCGEDQAGTRSKSAKPGKEHGHISKGSQSLARLRDKMRQSSATQEYPSLIDTFFVAHTVNGVFTRNEGRLIYEMRRLEATGTYIDDEINRLARRGKQRGHIPGVGRVLPARVTVGPSRPAPESTLKSLHKKVDFMMSLFKSDSKFSDAFSQFESAGSSESCESDGCGDDEESADDQEDEDEDGDGDSYDMSPGNMCHGGTNYLTEKYVRPTVSLGIVAGERIPCERSPASVPQRQVLGKEAFQHSPGFVRNAKIFSEVFFDLNESVEIGKAIVNSPQLIYDQEPSMVAEDDETSNDKEIVKLMALISLSFKKIYKPTNNNLRTSSNTSRANQDNSPRINRSAGYENQRIGNVAGARENVGSSVLSNYDQYNVFTLESVHPEQSKSVHDTYPIEQDAQNMIIDSLDMNYDRKEIDQNDDDNDLAKEREIEDFKNKNKSLESSNNFFKEANNKLSETNNLLYADYKKSEAELARRNSKEYASQMELECAKKEAQIKLYKTREDKELDKVIELENKVKVLDNIVYKIGQSVQTMNMLNNKCRTSFAKPEFLKKAQRVNPCLYDIGCYNDNLALMLAPDTDEMIRLEKESRSKLSDLIRPFDYDKLNNLYDLFVPQREKSSEQRYFSKRSRMSCG